MMDVMGVELALPGSTPLIDRGLKSEDERTSP